jgi:hypothetical protein
MSYYDYNVSWWENIETPSEDEKAIIQYLRDYELSGLSILHVGVGNNFIARHFTTSKITGLTISILEYQKALSLKYNSYLPVLIDKHDTALDSILDKYDIIIDNNIGSYSPNTESACEFLRVALNHLTEDGFFITHTSGLSYRNPFNLQEGLKWIGSTRQVQYGFNGIVVIK